MTVSFKFGDSRELNSALLELVRTGAKTATCGALRDFQNKGEALPRVGRRDVALDWDGNPALLIETVEVTIRRFCDIPEEFALAEGEGDYDAWRQAHIDFFTRNGGFHPEMDLVCERFRLVETY
ncbi:ASCH domain-containing protein [Paracoccus aerodenitrificans]|uniref:ASCH domain-containing protein n=1 Tax=Paracoccus aerodenitrificans TaxID=3017781 RepID=UPI0022F0C9A7|nr:ASCH domain-containing protein [Paracoccus aerodenitrificans]WBU65323.1 ASCH domain-containing protein [Paracoccus aerodenitrificans]